MNTYLYIDDTSIRLTVIEGNSVRQWSEVILEPGILKGMVVTSESVLTNKIRQLFKDQKISTRRVTLIFSGIHSLTRHVTLPKLPKSMLAGAVMAGARKALPLPLDQLYTSWKKLPSREGKNEVFVVAVPRRTADSMVKVVRDAGVEPYRMHIKPMILARAAGEDTAIIIDIQSNEFDIVLLSKGIPHPIRTISFRTEALSLEERVSIVVNDLEQTLKFFNSNNPEKALADDVPVYVSGELINSSEQRQALSKALSRQVYSLIPPIEAPPQIDMSRYVTNCLCALKIPTGIRQNTFVISDMNVLPEPYRPKPVSLVRVLAIPGTAVVASLVLPLIMLTQVASNNIDSVQSQLDNTNRIVAQKQMEKAVLEKSIVETEKKIEAIKAESQNISQALSGIAAQQENVNGNLMLVISLVSEDIKLNDFSNNGDSLIVSGSTASEANVLTYARTLEASGRFSDINIASLSNISGESVSFTLVMKEVK
jgi:hypothetical protein